MALRSNSLHYLATTVPIAMLVFQTSLSQASAQDASESSRRAEDRPFYFDRLAAENPNFFGYAIPNNDNDLDDENHFEFYLSVKYPLFTKPDDWPILSQFMDYIDAMDWIPHRMVFFYNGLYDFYLNSSRYPSAPIISRQQNPGAALEWDSHQHLNWRLGYFHESNGQTLSESNAYAQAEADFGEEYALSQVSRGWDYANFRLLFDSNPKRNKEIKSWWRTSLELRHYFDFQGFGTIDREDEIFWEPVNHQPEIQDYDGIRTMLEYTFDRGNGFMVNGAMGRIELKTGIGSTDALGKVGGKCSFGLKLGNTWLTTFYFNGYGKEPSSYHLRTEYFGIGIELH